jgi:hypothetical protein
MANPLEHDDAEGSQPEVLDERDPFGFRKAGFRIRFEQDLEDRPLALQGAIKHLIEELKVDPSDVTIGQWLSLLQDPDPDVRASVAREFGPLQNPAYTASDKPLIKIRIRDKDIEVTVSALCGLIKSNKDGDVTASAITSLRRFGLDAALVAVPALIPLIEGDDPQLQEAAITALPSFGPDAASEAVPALIRTLGNRSADIRLATCGTLA